MLSMLLILSLVLGSIPVAADATDGSVTEFTNGVSITVELAGDVMNLNHSIELPRNVTFQSATFDIVYDDNNPSPGNVWLDINQDGTEEWAWNGTGMGAIGEQTIFVNDASSNSIVVASGTSTSIGFNLPGTTSMFLSQMNASFIPTLGGGMYSVGEILDLDVADIDSDGLPEIIVLSNQPGGNSSANKSIGWMEWDSTTSSMSNITWVETCAGGSRLVLGDINNDSIPEVGVVDAISSSVCVHMSGNNSTIYNSAYYNVTVVSNMIDLGFADIDGDGFGDVISIHGNGEISVRFYQDSSSDFSDVNYSDLIESNTSIGQPAQLLDLEVGELSGSGSGWFAVVADGENHVSVWAWNIPQQQWVSPSSFDGIKENLHLYDIDGDGYLDAVGSTDFGHSVSSFNGSSWNTSEGGMLSLMNSTIADADHDGVLDIITPVRGLVDGNDSTQVGKLEVRPLNLSGIGNLSTTVFEPVTAPTQIVIADLDGDGRVEHILAAGEANPGIFIVGWHGFSVDVDQDGVAEFNVSGYSGNGSAGLALLGWSDDANIVKTAIDARQQTAAFAMDLWGNQFFTVTPDVTSAGEGVVLLDSLNLTYDVIFTVDLNPYASGNFSNVLNQLMEGGGGTFNITLPVNSTSSGRLTFKNLEALYTAGAPHLQLPPTPVLELDIYSHQGVQFSWQDSLDFGDSFLNFQIFRVINGTELDTALHEFDSSPLNMTIDSNVTPGKTYDYWVRSIHQFGVSSNLSDVLTVTIPFPDMINPVVTSLVDRSADEGGWLQVSWTDPSLGIIDHFDVYVSSSDFSNISGMTPVITADPFNFSVEVNISSEGPITDGTLYWAASVPVDIYDRYMMNVSAAGPSMSRNDSQLASDIGISLTDGASVSNGSTVLSLSRASSLQITVDLSGAGSAIEDSVLNMTITSDGSSWNMSYEGNTDVNGKWIPLDVADLDMFLGLEHVAGHLSVVVIYAGFEGDVENQPLSGSVASADLNILVHATFSVIGSEVRVDDQGSTQAQATLTTSWPIDQSAAVLATTVEYNAVNLSTGDGEVGAAAFEEGGGLLVQTNLLPQGGVVFLNITALPQWLVVDTSSVSVQVLPPLPTENDSGELILINPVFVCETIALPMEAPSSDISTKCTASNPNEYYIIIDWSDMGQWIDSANLSVTAQPGSLNVQKQGEVDFLLRFTWDGNIADLSEGNHSMNLSGDLQYGSETIQISQQVNWTLNQSVDPDDDPDDPSTNNGGGNDDNALDENKSSGGDSKFLTYAMYAGGGVIGLGAIIVAGTILFGGRVDEEDEDEDEDDWEDSFSAFDDDAPSASKALSRVSRPDTVKFQERRHKPESEPEPESSQVESAYEEPEYLDEEWEGDTDDDGVTIDEDGTEWWEDEEGIWWYRTAEMEDWAEYEE